MYLYFFVSNKFVTNILVFFIAPSIVSVAATIDMIFSPVLKTQKPQVLNRYHVTNMGNVR